MAIQKRIQILTQVEKSEFYSPPQFSSNEQRFFFTLNDNELSVAKNIRNRQQRYMFMLLLGYFKSKPIILKPGYHQIKQDLKFLYMEAYPGAGFRPFNLTEKEHHRIYSKILELCNYHRWILNHQSSLTSYLSEQAKAWSAPRYLFDEAIDFLSNQNIAIPGYSTLQDIISQVIASQQKYLSQFLNKALPSNIKRMINVLVNDNEDFSLQQLRQAARNFIATELEKEVLVYDHLKNSMCEINTTLNTLLLSQKNQEYFASRVDYYGAKLKRQSEGNQRLFMLCYLKLRWQQALERIAEGFIHHVRQAKQKAKSYAQEAVFQDWKNAANNVGKAAEILHLFIDENIDNEQPFGNVKTQAFKLLDEKNLESVCLFLNRQKRSVDEATWQYYDEKPGLREDLLRKLFLCLDFEGCEGVKRLAQALNKLKDDLIQYGTPNSIDGKVIAKKHRCHLERSDKSIHLERYEWLLYLQIPDRMDGRLTLPEIIKYRSLEADLIDSKRWNKEKEQLLEKSTLSKLNAEPESVIVQMSDDLTAQISNVNQILENNNNSNIVLRSSTGK